MSKISLCLIGNDQTCLQNIDNVTDDLHIIDGLKTSETLNKFHELTKYDFIILWDESFRIDKVNVEGLIKLLDEIDEYNLVYLNLGRNLNTNNSKKIPYPFIYKKSDFYWKSIYPKLENKVKIKPILDRSIVVEKLFDETINNDGVEELIHSTKDNYLISRYTDDLLVQGNFSKALEFLPLYSDKNPKRYILILEKFVKCYLNLGNIEAARVLIESEYNNLNHYPRFLLLYADVMSVLSLSKSKIYYMNYIKSLESGKINTDYDYYRFAVHPYEMLKQINNQ